MAYASRAGKRGAFRSEGRTWPDLAIQQIPDLMDVKGVGIVGPLPGDLQNVTMFAAGIGAGSAHGDTAKALIRFLQMPESAAVIRKHGLEPATAGAPARAW